MPVVKEFSDVFPNELPRLPPDREVEFVIDIIPKTELILEAPYRMAPIEIKELMAQLQNYLIRNSSNRVSHLAEYRCWLFRRKIDL